MQEEAMMLKIVAIVLGGIAALYLGMMALMVIAPLFLVAVVIDTAMRSAYNRKLDDVRKQGELVIGPDLDAFDARIVDGQVLVGWRASLPHGAHLDIYRLTGSGGGSASEIQERGTCVHSTTTEQGDRPETVFIDYGVAQGAYFYVPVVSGLEKRRTPIDYSFLAFYRELQFRERKSTIRARGDAVYVDVSNAEPVIADDREPTEKLVDEILGEIRERRKIEEDLDVAIERIRISVDLSDEEKEEAIELLETRAVEL